MGRKGEAIVGRTWGSRVLDHELEAVSPSPKALQSDLEVFLADMLGFTSLTASRVDVGKEPSAELSATVSELKGRQSTVLTQNATFSC
jgi:hypothetical protein